MRRAVRAFASYNSSFQSIARTVLPSTARPNLLRSSRTLCSMSDTSVLTQPASSTSHPAPVPGSVADAVAAASAPAKAKGEKKVKPKKSGAATDELAGQMASLELDPPPAYFAHRMALFDRLKKEYDEMVASQPRETIQITLKDGTVKEGTSWETSPMHIAKGIGGTLRLRILQRLIHLVSASSFAEKMVIAKVYSTSKTLR